LAKIDWDFGKYGAPSAVRSILNQLNFADDQLMGPAQMGTDGENGGNFMPHLSAAHKL
jgi:hypothetical protein